MPPVQSHVLRAGGLTALALIAFAANSVLARQALDAGAAGPWTFTLVRIATGAAALALLTRRFRPKGGSWASAAALLAYAGLFSAAYLALASGTGALILFAVVQATMIGWTTFRGQPMGLRGWAGLAIAMTGLAVLLSPGVAAPPLWAALAMAGAGVGWGVYSLRGRGVANPGEATADNFIRAALIAIIASPLVFVVAGETAPSTAGLLLATASGAITSGLGYVVWYAALRHISASQAAISQLSVPALAALGGVAFLAEPLTFAFAATTALILAGIALSLTDRGRRT